MTATPIDSADPSAFPVTNPPADHIPQSPFSVPNVRIADHLGAGPFSG